MNSTNSPPSDNRWDQEFARLLGADPSFRDMMRGCRDLQKKLDAELGEMHLYKPAPEGLLENETPETTTLGDFQLIRPIGRGGMGVVYEGRQISMDRKVAVKVLPGGLLADLNAVSRFHREAKAAGRLQHPNIVSVFGMGVDQDTPYYTMEFVEGETLAEILRRLRRQSEAPERFPFRAISSVSQLLTPMDTNGAEPATETQMSADAGTTTSIAAENRSGSDQINLQYCLNLARAFAGVAEGLQHAHENGVIHRDVKPSNLILDRKGRLRILDFGLARLEGQDSLTLSGDILGTILYMSPEQVLPGKTAIDPRTDVYSLGATLYEMLTLRPPFKGTSNQGTITQIISRDPTPLRRLNHRVPRELETIVLKCLRKERERRYSTAEALAQDLRRYVRGDPIEARPQTVWERIARRAWRQKGKVAVAVGAVLLLITTALLIRAHNREALLEKEKLYSDKIRDAVMMMHFGRPSSPGREPGGAQPDHHRLLQIAYAAEKPEGAGTDQFIARALVRLEEATKLFPRKPDAYYHWARGLRAKKRSQEALRVLERATEYAPRFVPARTLLASLLERPGGEPRPREPGRSADGLEDSDWAQAWLAAHRATAREHWSEAAAAYTRLLDLTPAREEPYIGASMEIRLGRGLAYLELRELDPALEDFAAAQALWPDTIVPSLFLGKTYYLKGDRGTAEAKLQRLLGRTAFPNEVALKVVSLYHDLADYERGLAWTDHINDDRERKLKRSDLLRHLGRLEEAAQTAREALESGSDNGESGEALNLLGIALKHQGKFVEAAAAYRKAIAIDPDSVGFHSNLANALVEEGKLEEALDERRKAIELAPHDFEVRLFYAATLEESGRLEEAVREYHRAVALEPESVEAHNSLGGALSKLRRYEAALHHYGSAISIDPESARAHDGLGTTLEKQGKLDDAVEKLRLAIKLDPENHAYHEHLGAALREQGKFDEAIQKYDEAIALAPDCQHARHGRGIVFAKQGQLEKALAEFEKALRMDENLATAHSSIGLVLSQQGKPKEAVARHRRAVALDPRSAQAHSNLGATLVDQGNFKEAVDVFRTAIALDPGDPNLVYNLGVARRELGELDEAKLRFRQALKMDPRMENAHLNLGSVFLVEEDLEQAGAHYEQAIEINPKSAMGHYNLGIVRRKQGKLEEAIFHHRKAAEFETANPRVLNRLGILLEEAGREKEASRVYREAIRVDPNYVPARNNLALLLVDGNELGEAISHFREAVRRQPAYLKGYYNLITALEKNQQLPEALAVCQEALSICERMPRTGATEAPSRPGLAEFLSAAARLARKAGREKDSRQYMTRALATEKKRVDGPDVSARELNEHAWRLLTCEPADLRDPERALVCARRAVEATKRQDPEILDTLALAFFQTDEVAEAVRTQEEAVFLSGGKVSFTESLEKYRHAALPDLVTYDSIEAALAKLEVDPLPDLEEERQRFEEFRRAAGNAANRIAYLEGRLLQRAGKHREAAQKLEEVVAVDKTQPQPWLRLAESLRAAGSAAEAVARLDDALQVGVPGDGSLRDLWIAVSLVDLKRSPGEILASRPLSPALSGGGANLRFLLEQLAAHGVLRINCGGEAYENPAGITWGKDRFFRGGHRGCGRPPFTGELAKTEDDPLYQTERWFPDEGRGESRYRVPLPPGRYRVTLHFAEIQHQESGKCRFDVLLEGQTVLPNYEPFLVGFATADRRTWKIPVRDGVLDLHLIRHAGTPKISAIEVQVLPTVNSD